MAVPSHISAIGDGTDPAILINTEVCESAAQYFVPGAREKVCRAYIAGDLDATMASFFDPSVYHLAAHVEDFLEQTGHIFSERFAENYRAKCLERDRLAGFPLSDAFIAEIPVDDSARDICQNLLDTIKKNIVKEKATKEKFSKSKIGVLKRGLHKVKHTISQLCLKKKASPCFG